MIPIVAATPAATAIATSAGSGRRFSAPRSSATTVTGRMPTTWTMSATPRTGARRLAQPPPKSPAAPARSPRRGRRRRPPSPVRTAQPWADLAPAGSAAYAGEVVDLRRPGERDDRIGRRVVAIRRRQVDDLEVAGDVAEELEGPRRAGVVERDERVVEDQRRPPVAGHEPDEPDPGDEIDEIERALAERRDVDPVAALRRVERGCRASCRRPGRAGSGPSVTRSMSATIFVSR